ncbi:sensor histidine kinase [Rhizobium rhizogenes]|uniref:sensor histidine kinase n=1 Tax=Rhizobium rhizogenes TaxID=359 RepID=UPI00226EB550|nr:histidine kinase dimerization/phosphoacceptor domain -containing protein [Rhizobium rhizogenes]
MANAKILYVDDDPALARLAERILSRNGYQLHHAPSVAAGIVSFEQEEFDAVVLDHYLQDSTGLHFLETIGEKARTVPILYVTGSSDAQIAITALRNGATDYVMKSSADDFFPLLISTLDQAVENHRLRRAKEAGDRQLLLAKERAELLLAEMNHRIANSLALVSAMIRMQMQTVSTEDTKAALLETQSRISAIAGVHRSLYTSENDGEVEFDAYLRSLINELLSTTRSKDQNIDVIMEFDPMFVTPNNAVSLGVIATELVTNAIKYAFPGRSGHIWITLKAEAERATLSIRDDGIGFDLSGRAQGTGLGRKLINAMATRLEGQVDYDLSKGTHVTTSWSRQSV